MKLKFSLYKVVFLLVLFAASCATIETPEGGPRDTKGPTIKKSIPENLSKNFKGKTIVLEFDEYIEIKDLNNELIVSPPLKNVPEGKRKGKTFIFSINDTLAENITYNFNFGSAIRDLNESNPLDSNLFVFSTGDFIDSLEITGKVINAYSLQTEPGLNIMLYKNLEDSVPYKKIPDYISKSKKDGSFRLTNLASGKYKIFVLKDQNSNYLYDQPGELIAFHDTDISLDSNMIYNLRMFEEDKNNQFVKSFRARDFGKAELILNKKLSNYKIEFLSKKINYFEDIQTKGDTVNFWFYDFKENDSLLLVLSDTLNFIDTLQLELKGSPLKADDTEREQKRKKNLTVINASINASATNGLDIFADLQLKFGRPVQLKDASKIIFTKKSDTLLVNNFNFDKSQRSFQIKHPWQQDSSYKLLILPGAFSDFFSLENDTLKFDFKVKSDKDYGLANLKVNTPDASLDYVLELINERGSVFRTITFRGNLNTKIEKIVPGKYYLRLLQDTNGDGKWNTGDYMKKQQPEKILFNNKPLDIRQNWDFDAEWNITSLDVFKP